MGPSDGGSVLILGAGFNALAEERATCIGVDGFVHERSIEIAGEDESVGGAAQYDLEDLAGRLGKQRGPAFVRDPRAELAELLAQLGEQRATDDQCHENCVDEGLDDAPYARRPWASG